MAFLPTVYDAPGFVYDIPFVAYDGTATVDNGQIQWRFSAPAMAGGNLGSGAVGASLGAFVSTTLVNNTAIDNLFPDTKGPENLAGSSDYQCLFIVNTNLINVLQSPVVWFTAVPTSPLVAVAVDSIGVTDLSSMAPQATTIPNKNTTPIGVGAFTTPTSKAAGLGLADIGPGQTCAVWIQRTATGSPANAVYTGSIRVEGQMFF
jgi:hypothetical protein